MPRIRLRPELVSRALLVGAAFLATAPPPAAAGDVAPSAYSASLTMPAFLLDAPWQIHLHPQLTARRPAHVGATASEFSGAAAVQAVLRSGRLAFFAMSQSNDGLHTIPISSDVVQLGLAAEVGGLRLGAAARGTIARDDMTDLAVDPGGSNGSETIEEHRGDRIEGAFGVGLGGDETFLDLTFEVTRERFETAVWDSSYRGLAEVDIDGLPEIRFGGAVRVGFPGPWRTRLQLVGSFSDRTSDVNLDQTRTDSLRVTVRRDEYGHLWRGGLTVSADVRESSLTFYSLYVNQDGPTEYERLYSSYLEYHRTVDVDEVHFGMALRRDFWWETRLLVGIQNRFTLRKNRIFRIRDDERRDYDATTTEVLSRNFAWGLRRSFESLELTGAMRTDLSAGDLFLYLDVLYRL